MSPGKRCEIEGLRERSQLPVLKLRWCRGLDGGASCATRALDERVTAVFGGYRRELRAALGGDRGGDLGGEIDLEDSLAVEKGLDGWKLERDGLAEVGGVG